MSDGKARALRRLSHAALVLLITLIFAGLVLTVIALPPVAAGLSEEVNAELPRNGIHNPVTATLLDFRSYDTLLEIAVLLLAVTAIRALRRGDPSTMRPGDEVLAFLGRILVPVMILFVGYLLMAGLDSPGGAFQAGAILSAAGILLILTGRSVPLRDEGLPLRFGLAIGLAAFVAVGVAGMLVANAFLDYPQRNATAIVLLLEVGASVSIALALLEMFVGVLRGGNAGSATHVTKREKR
jgi:multisubunit Na+/H+ antiporter MnhB subunit